MIDKNRKKTLTVISLGVGVQSSTMLLMAAKGELPKVDCAIFADPGNESKASYLYFDFLKKIVKFPIYKVSKGNIREDIINSIKNNTKFPTAPFFTQNAIQVKKGC